MTTKAWRRFSKDVGSLNKRRILFAVMVVVTFVNLGYWIYTETYIDTTPGLAIQSLQTVVGLLSPFISGMLLDQNLRQKHDRRYRQRKNR